MPLWIIAWGLKARAFAAAAFKLALEPFAVTLPIFLWLGILLLLAVIVPLGQRAKGRQEGRAQIQATIDAPLTGWAARLDQCHTTEKTLRAGLDLQTATVAKRSQEATASLNASTAALRHLQPANERAARTAAQILKPLTGADACARVFEVDRRFVETLR